MAQELKAEVTVLRQFVGCLLNVRRRSDDAIVHSGIIKDASVSGCGGYGTIMLEGHQPFNVTRGYAAQHLFEILKSDGTKLDEAEKARVVRA